MSRRVTLTDAERHDLRLPTDDGFRQLLKLQP
jgi:hypothetical protein